MQMNRNREIAAFVLALLGLKGVGPRTVADAIAQHRDSLLGDACLDFDYAASKTAAPFQSAIEMVRISSFSGSSPVVSVSKHIALRAVSALVSICGIHFFLSWSAFLEMGPASCRPHRLSVALHAVVHGAARLAG